MSTRNFNIGDRCRIRQWDDMEAEFGVRDNGVIPCQASFMPQMKPLCGKPFTVTIKDGSRFFSEEKTEYINHPLDMSWTITADMLEYDAPKFEPVGEDALASLPGF